MISSEHEWPPRPHNPREREVVAHLGAWEVRQFATTDQKLEYFSGRGFLHVQLWLPEHGVSVLTPSRLTGGRFELWHGEDRTSLPSWSAVCAALPGIETPTPSEAVASERWFVLRHETAEIHLLRVWWASRPLARRGA